MYKCENKAYLLLYSWFFVIFDEIFYVNVRLLICMDFVFEIL